MRNIFLNRFYFGFSARGLLSLLFSVGGQKGKAVKLLSRRYKSSGPIFSLSFRSPFGFGRFWVGAAKKRGHLLRLFIIFWGTFFLAMGVGFPTLWGQAQTETFYQGSLNDLAIPIEPIPDTLEQISVLLLETPNVSTVGFLVALEEGYYEEIGLPPVRLRRMNERTSGLREQRLGYAQFSVIWMTRAYHHNALGSLLVSIGRFGAGSLNLLVRRDLHPDIRRLEDLDGYSIGVHYRNEEYIQIVLEALGIRSTLIPYTGNGLILLRNGAVDGLCCSSYLTGTAAKYSKFRNDYRSLSILDTGIVLPELCVMTLQPFLMKHPRICRDFMLATWRGWRKAYQDEEMALSVLKKYYVSQSFAFNDRIVRQQWAAWTASMPLSDVLEENGVLSRDEFEVMRDLMIRVKMIEPDKAASYDDFFFPVTMPETVRRIEELQGKADDAAKTERSE